MLNAHHLRQDFVTALERAWSPDAIWPGCKDGYKHGVSHPSYGQCLVGTLATWSAHGDLEGQFRIVPGVLKGDNLPYDGVWHFQMSMIGVMHKLQPIDVTWDQAVNGCFTSAMSMDDDGAYARIVDGSFPGDSSLVPRLDIILRNLKKQGILGSQSSENIVRAAYDTLLP